MHEILIIKFFDLFDWHYTWLKTPYPLIRLGATKLSQKELLKLKISVCVLLLKRKSSTMLKSIN